MLDEYLVCPFNLEQILLVCFKGFGRNKRANNFEAVCWFLLFFDVFGWSRMKAALYPIMLWDMVVFEESHYVCCFCHIYLKGLSASNMRGDWTALLHSRLFIFPLCFLLCFSGYLILLLVVLHFFSLLLISFSIRKVKNNYVHISSRCGTLNRKNG